MQAATQPKTPWNPSKRATARIANPMPAPVECPHCRSNVRIANNSEIYRGRSFGDWPWVYVCEGPECMAYVGMHPYTAIPLGILATEEMREYRKRAKSLFNPIWQNGKRTRTEAYRWLANLMGLEPGDCHFGMFDVQQCKEAIRIMRASLHNIHARG